MIRIEVIDPYDGDRDPGEWAVGIEFSWFTRGPEWGRAGFRGLSFTLFRWQLLLGQELKF